MNSVNLLGVKVSCVDKPFLMDCAAQWGLQASPRTIFYVNAHCLNIAAANPEYRALLNRADLVYADGIGAVWAGRLLGGAPLEKITGRDWIDDFCRLAGSQRLGIYILGGKPGVARRASENLLKKYPTLKLCGAQDGFFSEKNAAAVLADIAAAGPQVVFVGLGTPLQEQWIAQNRAAIAAPVCWAVGALFDYVAGVETPAPAWWNGQRLEWLWRLIMDPQGKWRRYLLGNPLFVLRVLRQKYFKPDPQS